MVHELRGAEPASPDAPPPEADADPERAARTILLRMLTGAPRSRAQLAEKLAKEQIAPEVAERVLERFIEVGLIDDAAYAEMVVHSAHGSRGLGRRAVVHELRRRGVGAEDAEQAMVGLDDESDEVTARALLERRWPGWSRLDPQVRDRRALGMLARKGFSGGLSSRLIREMGDDRATHPWIDPEGAAY